VLKLENDLLISFVKSLNHTYNAHENVQENFIGRIEQTNFSPTDHAFDTRFRY